MPNNYKDKNAMEDTRKHKRSVRRRVKKETPTGRKTSPDEQAEIDALLAKKEAKWRRQNTPERRARRKRRNRILLALLAIIIAVCAFLYIKIHPLYVEAQSQMYDILSEMNYGTFKRASNTTVYDKDGNLIGKVGYENYEYVDISKISEYIQKGYIDVEDQRFETHHGVDWIGTLRAALMYIKNRGRITQGGSTITQQVVKNNVLTQQKTFSRKVLEIMLALEIEKKFNKAEIMEFYCNSNYYGNGCYGVQGAAKYYFGKDAKSVDIAEAAMLVGISNRPSAYDPVAHYDACMKKKNSVLKKMYDAGTITKDEYTAAVAEQPAIVQQSSSVGSQNYMTTYAVHCATLKLMAYDGFQFQYTFDSKDTYDAYEASYKKAYDTAYNAIESGGYEIDTSLDQNAQSELEDSINEVLAGETDLQDDGRYDMQSAAVCIDNSTGLVVAAVGGRGGTDSYNRVFQANRPAGSSIKPLLVYGPGLNEGVVTPATVMTDQPIDINGYSPSNADGQYIGDVTVREALARSINTIAVQLFNQVGDTTALSYLGKLNFSTLSYADNYDTAAALGSLTNGVTVEDMTRGYATIENQGQMRDNTCIQKLVSEKNGTIYSYDKDSATKVYTKDTAYMLTSMMEGTFREDYGTAHAYEDDSQIYAGKTGTTNDNHDAWFGGFSTYYTTVVWTGCDTPKSNENLVGNGYPLAIWSSFMSKLHSGLTKTDFTMPDTILLQDSSGNQKTQDSSDDYWATRPDGWDYVSKELEQTVEEKQRQIRVEQEKEAAESAVSDFESFQITSVDDAEALDSKYQSVLSTISAIEDASEQSTYQERAAYKYQLLSGDVADKWESVIEEQAKEQQAKTDSDNAAAAQSSASEAESEVKSLRISAVQSYIDALNSIEVYISSVETLYTNGKAALENCSDYSEYSTLSSELTDAYNSAKSKPTQADYQSQQAAAQSAAAKAASDAAAAQAAQNSAKGSTTTGGTTGGTTANNTTKATTPNNAATN